MLFLLFTRQFLNVRRAMNYAESVQSPFFAEVKAVDSEAEAAAPPKSTPSPRLPCDLVFRVKVCNTSAAYSILSSYQRCYFSFD